MNNQEVGRTSIEERPVEQPQVVETPQPTTPLPLSNQSCRLRSHHNIHLMQVKITILAQHSSQFMVHITDHHMHHHIEGTLYGHGSCWQCF